MTSNAKTLIEVKNVSKRFHGVVALDSVSFQLKSGEQLGIIGVNGSGKTTILNILSRLIDPDNGDLLYKGESYLKIKTHHLINYGFARSFQYTRNWKNMSVIENLINFNESWSKINYWDCIFNRKKQERIDAKILLKAEQIIDFLNIPLLNDSNKLVGELSIGQQRIVELIRTFLMDPKVLLLDEPSVGLSSEVSNKLGKYLMKIAKEGNGILIVSHDLMFVKENADRIIFLSQGNIIAEGSYENVINNKYVMEAYLGKIR